MEDWVLGIIGGIIVTVVSGIILGLVFRKREGKGQDKRQTAKVKDGEVFQAQDKSKIVIDKSVGKKVFQGVKEGPPPLKSPQRGIEKTKPKQEIVIETIVKELLVHPGDTKKISKHIEKGSRIEGIAEDIDSDFFYFYIVDDADYEILRNTGEPDNALYTGLNEGAYHFNKKIPHSGFWHFIFDTYNLKSEREIDFRCTILRKGGN
jgi:hypothetical protein